MVMTLTQSGDDNLAASDAMALRLPAKDLTRNFPSYNAGFRGADRTKFWRSIRVKARVLLISSSVLPSQSLSWRTV